MMEWTETKIHKNLEDIPYQMAIYEKNGNEVCSKRTTGVDRAGQKDFRLIAAAPNLLEACKKAKKYLEPNLTEPGRTIFWDLVDAITKATE